MLQDRRAYVHWACVCAGAAADPWLRSCCGRKPWGHEQTLHRSWDAPTDRAHSPHLTQREGGRTYLSVNLLFKLLWMGIFVHVATVKSCKLQVKFRRDVKCFILCLINNILACVTYVSVTIPGCVELFSQTIIFFSQRSINTLQVLQVLLKSSHWTAELCRVCRLQHTHTQTYFSCLEFLLQENKYEEIYHSYWWALILTHCGVCWTCLFDDKDALCSHPHSLQRRNKVSTTL